MSDQGNEETRPDRPIPIYGAAEDDLDGGDEYAPDDQDDYDDLAEPGPPHGGAGGHSTPPPPFRPGPRELRVLGIIAVLALVTAVLLLPPLSLLKRAQGGSSSAGQGLSTRARSSMPSLPQGLEAASALYDITGTRKDQGPVILTVRLSKPVTDTKALAYYTYTSGDWRRLASVSTTEGGKSVQGDLVSVPTNIAVLRRAAFAHAFGAIILPGDTLDPAATDAGIVSVLAGEPSAGDDGLQISDRLTGTLQGRYLGLTTSTATSAASINRILGDTSATRRHVDAIAGAAAATQADGVHVDYMGVDPTKRGAFTAFIQQLAVRLKQDNRGLVVSVPTPASSDPDAYDWLALQKAASALWLRAPADPAAYYDQVETALRTRRDNGVDLSKVSLVIDRRSRDRAGDVIRAITLRAALTTASVVRARIDQGIAPGDSVSLSAANIDQDAGNSGLRWDDRSHAVMFAYAGPGGAETVWIEDRFSIAFRLDLAQRYNLGGIVVEGATHDDSLPDAWNTILAYTNDGQLTLQTPYGPYLQPSWRASDGQIQVSATNGSAIWQAPARTGTFQVTLVASDGVVFVGQRIDLNVTTNGGRTPTPTPTPSATPTPATTRAPTPAAGSGTTASPTASSPTARPTTPTPTAAH